MQNFYVHDSLVCTQGSLTPTKRAEEACQALETPAVEHLAMEIKGIVRHLTERVRLVGVTWGLNKSCAILLNETEAQKSL
jgi:hypothetical protein